MRQQLYALFAWRGSEGCLGNSLGGVAGHGGLLTLVPAEMGILSDKSCVRLREAGLDVDDEIGLALEERMRGVGVV